MDYDIIIIGGGPAGYSASLEAASRGMKTVLMEKSVKNLGGVCLNEGCVPFKGFLYYSRYENDYSEIKEKVMKRAAGIREGLEKRLRSKKIEIIEGEAKFADKNSVECGGKTYTAENILIAAGSSAKNIIKSPSALPSEKVFGLEKLPSKVILAGGGVIGCEFATFFNNLGCEVVIVELTGGLLPGVDEEAVRALTREFKKKKIKIITESTISDIKEGAAVIKTGEKEKEEKCGAVFEVIGRQPEVSKLGLESAGVKADEKGFVITDNNYRTNIDNIYAAGDCINTPMLAYTAMYEGEAAVKNIAGEKTKKPDYSAMPFLTYSSPKVGYAGKTEGGTIYKYFFRAVGKAVVEGKESGFLRLHEESGVITGAVAVGEEITELMNELAVIVNNRMKAEDILSTMHLHPSYSEIITDALRYGKQ